MRCARARIVTLYGAGVFKELIEFQKATVGSRIGTQRLTLVPQDAVCRENGCLKPASVGAALIKNEI